MTDDIVLIVGLGNPGSKYQYHRHNIGFMATDEIIRRYSFKGPQEKHKGLLYSGMIGTQKCLIMQPQTYMNESGQSVQSVAAFYKVKPENVIVFYDELDIACGKVKIKQGGGSGGHNGIKSIDAHLGKNYWRIRLGIDHPGHKDRVSGYVLSNFSKQDQEWLDPLLPVLAEHVSYALEKNMGKYMTQIARTLYPERGTKT